MKTEQEILERIEHIKTLSNGYGINERRIKELEWVIKPSKLSQHDVSGRSELLLAFTEWYNNNEIIKPRSLILKDDVLVFLSQQ